MTHEGTWQPDEEITLKYGDFLRAIKDATNAGIENERAQIAERVNKLHESAIHIGASPLVIDGIHQALNAVVNGGVQE